MTTAYRRTTVGGFSDAGRTWPVPSGFKARETASFGITARVWIVRTLGLAFAAGIVTGLYKAIGDHTLDTNGIATFVFRSVGTTIGLPAEGAVTVFNLSPHAAEMLRTAMYFLSIPYQTVAFAGAYAASLAFQMVHTVLASLPSHF